MIEPEINVINMKVIEEARALMSDRFPMMIRYFIEDTEMYLGEIARAIQENNIEIAISPAHTIKSSSKQIGAEKLSAVAKATEELCRNANKDEQGAGDYQKLETLYKQLKEEFERVMPELNSLCQ